MKALGIVIVALGLLAGGSAIAQEKAGDAPKAAEKTGKVKEQFYNFDDMLIDGDYKKPSALLLKGRDRVRFTRLLKLKKSFLPAMLRSARAAALK